jgi:hypothetical protein
MFFVRCAIDCPLCQRAHGSNCKGVIAESPDRRPKQNFKMVPFTDCFGSVLSSHDAWDAACRPVHCLRSISIHS